VVGAEGTGRLVELGEIRGDVDAPLAVGFASYLFGAVLEPTASGYDLRIGRVLGDEVRWGVEFVQGKDASLAFDVAVNESVGVAVWDDLSKGKKQSQIVVATFDPRALAVKSRAQPVIREAVDAELPRVIRRPGGFWLAYVASSTVELPSRPDDEDLGRDSNQERYAAEKIEHSWLEVVPLNDEGRLAGRPRQVTNADGYIQGFDIEVSDDGAAFVAWRDDDTPSGAHGGQVSLVVVRMGGIDQPRIVAGDEVGAGVPNLLPGWIAVTDKRGRARLAPLTPGGLLRGELLAEPVIGVGQPLAAGRQGLWLAQPAGKAVDLMVVHCDPSKRPSVLDGGQGSGGQATGGPIRAPTTGAPAKTGT